MRFGLQIPNFTAGGPPGALFDGVVAMATAAEEAGFDSVWVMDHFYQLPPLGGPSEPMLDSYTLLGALAARTSSVRLGTMVTGVTYRNPAHLAKIVTTLDVISAGRAILGIGAAWYDVEHEGLGFDFPPAGERLDRLEEALQICRAMFREDAPSFDGRYYRIHEARNVPPPVQAGGPPILIGGGGEKRTLQLVARYADMTNIVGDAATIAHKVDVLRGHCAVIGRDPSEVTVSRLSTLVLTESEAETAATLDFLEQAMGERPSGAADVGTADQLVAQVEELAAAGVEYFVFNMPTGSPDMVRRVGETLVARFPG
jgi:F420-dependent oxidoreductase-like protein